MQLLMMGTLIYSLIGCGLNTDLQELVMLHMIAQEVLLTKRLYVDFASTEATQAAGVKSFDSDGFTLGTAGASNGSGITFVSWQWHANSGTTSSNSSGSITSTVQANTDAGFSIVHLFIRYRTSAETIGHGLGASSPAYVFGLKIEIKQ